MVFTLFKTTLKKNWVLFMIFIGVLAMYLGVMILMFDPNDINALMEMVQLFPEGLLNALGFAGVITGLTGYLASWLYGMLMLVFPMVYCIILANRLVAKKVDSGSFAYLLSTPHSRTQIIITQGAYALSSIAAMFTVVFGLGVMFSEMMLPGLLDIGVFFMLNVTTMLVNMAVIMISFCASCIFNSTKLSLGFGAGIPIAFVLMNMIGGVSEKIHWLKSMSIYGQYDPFQMTQGASVLGPNLLYIGLSAVLFTASVFVFKRKQLPI